MMQIEDAANLATEYLLQMAKINGENITDIRIEAMENLENSEDEGYFPWEITLGYFVDSQSLLGECFVKSKEYKKFSIDSDGVVRRVRNCVLGKQVPVYSVE
ncbi:hypothetical protein [Roseofilum casamattae]|uniref:Immunity protein 35 domain-containing protein n=1 Tax=Roseofilum casamattae BLCC-M143 TaxID=3022442 RepID=A0ABT7C3D5_9CYAN|nr:hypothetical protein [Roseofilum casamattae]MDJ1185269.1 hypothetical protein [Roseofilum casamattae BLCC-M143]